MVNTLLPHFWFSFISVIKYVSKFTLGRLRNEKFSTAGHKDRHDTIAIKQQWACVSKRK